MPFYKLCQSCLLDKYMCISIALCLKYPQSFQADVHIESEGEPALL